MALKCMTEDCKAPFDYRKGQLLPFSHKRAGSQAIQIQHFWLCDECCKSFALENRAGKLLVRRTETSGVPPAVLTP